MGLNSDRICFVLKIHASSLYENIDRAGERKSRLLFDRAEKCKHYVLLAGTHIFIAWKKCMVSPELGHETFNVYPSSTDDATPRRLLRVGSPVHRELIVSILID